MNDDVWRSILVACLATNAVIGFAYRVYRLAKGGPMSDVVGQAILGVLLASVAIGLALQAMWLRWVALGYAALFGTVVMPIWMLAVLIPMRPGKLDVGFTVVYWVVLLIAAVAAIAA